MNCVRQHPFRDLIKQNIPMYCCSSFRGVLGVLTSILFLSQFCLCLPDANAQMPLVVEPLVVVQEGEQYNLAAYTAVFEDKTNTVPISTIAKQDFKGFAALRSVAFSEGYTPSTYWFTFKVIAPPNQAFNWLLEVGYPNLYQLELYVLRNGRNPVVKRGGAVESFEKREFISPSFVFALDDSANITHALPDTLTCYLRVQTQSAMIVPLKLYTPRAFERLTIVEYLLYGLLYGVMAAMACYNLFLAISVRERYYLYYVCYVLMFLLSNIAIKGLGAVFIQSSQIHWIRILPFSMPVSSLCAVLFARHFLRPKEYSVWADNVLYGVIVFHCIIIALTFIAPFSIMAPTIAIMIGVVCVILIVVGIVSMRSGYRPARFFVAGWSVFLLGSMLRSLSTIGIIPFSWRADHIPIVGAALETLLLSFALADRINILKRQQASVLEQAVAERTAELNNTNAALEEANRFKTQMLSIAAHDLKNPLSQIIAYADLAEMEKENPDAVSSMVRKLHQSADGMLTLVKNVLDSASLDLGKIHIVYDRFSLSALLISVSDRFTYAASKKQQTIRTEIDNHLEIIGDSGRLQQVFDNLLSNAIKYSPAEKQIYVRAQAMGNVIRVEVQDEGPGLTEDDQSKLFGFFQRLSAQPTGGESSNGVGLAIVKKIVDLHEGRIWVTSEMGRGATFIVELPIRIE